MLRLEVLHHILDNGGNRFFLWEYLYSVGKR